MTSIFALGFIAGLSTFAIGILVVLAWRERDHRLDPDAFEAARRWGFTIDQERVDQIERELHADHGRGTAEDGPDGSDCGCRATEHQLACANTGCGFCLAAAPRASGCGGGCSQ